MHAKNTLFPLCGVLVGQFYEWIIGKWKYECELIIHTINGCTDQNSGHMTIFKCLVNNRVTILIIVTFN